MLTQVAEIKSPVDASQQVSLKHASMKLKVEGLVLPVIQSTHHEAILPIYRYLMDT
jgi:hypothetical protein